MLIIPVDNGHDPTQDIPMVDDPCEELAAVEAQLEQVRAIMQRLTRKTHVLKANINNIYSPILRILPPEVISNIFEFCSPSWSLYPIDHNREFPLKLGAVCSGWRKIAWTTPTLWASVTLYLTRRNMNLQVSLLDEWLSRSGDLPLYINLYSDHEHSWNCPDAPEAAIDVIKKYTSRWRSLHLQLPTSCFTSLPGLDYPLPHLTALHLDPIGGQTERSHTVDMSHAQLKVLGLSRVYLTSVNFGFDHVTHLDLQSFYVDESLKVLSQSPQLIDCTLRNFIDGRDSHILPATPILLPALKYLKLENMKDTPIPLLLDSILIPNVIALTYSGRHLLHIPNMCALITRSTSLQTFSLIKTMVPSEDIFLQLLSALNSVTEFILEVNGTDRNVSPLTDRILQQLNPQIAANLGVDCLMPSLEALSYRGPLSFSMKESIAVVRSRLPGDWPLRNRIHSHCSISRPVNSWRVFKIDLTNCVSDMSNARQYLTRQLQQISLEAPQVDIIFSFETPDGLLWQKLKT